MSLSAPPVAPDAEAAVAGSALRYPESLASLREFLRPADFYCDDARRVFAAACAIADDGRVVSLVAACEHLRALPEGSAYEAVDMAGRGAMPGDARALALIVRERSIAREVLARTAEITRRAADPTEDALDVLDSLRRVHDEIAGALPGRAMVDQAEALKRLADFRAAGADAGVPCRLAALSSMVGSWRPGKLYIGGGRPGMGKSAHAKSEAIHVASLGHSVAVFTLEMEADEYAERMEAECGARRLDPAALPVHYHDAPRLTTAEMRARLFRLQTELRGAGRPPLALVVVDYIQLMQGRGDNREQEVSQISRDLKVLAREFRVAVLALAQLNRGVESRADKRPMLADLRESGGLEQDADAVLFYYRPAYYTLGATATVSGLDVAAGDETDSLCEIIVAKQRRGPTGSAWARFHGPTTSFRDYDEARPVANPSLGMADAGPRPGRVPEIYALDAAPF